MSLGGATAARPVSGRGGRVTKYMMLGGLIALLVVFCVLSVSIGSRDVSLNEIINGVLGRTDSFGEAAVAMRVPRTLLALIAGAALGLAGAVMQGVTRNPLADPGILGVNTGASLAVVVGVVWFNIYSVEAYVWSAIFGAGATAAMVYTIGSMGRGGATPLKLALAGAATSIALSSLVIAIVLPRNDIAGGIRSWQIGGVGGASFDRIVPILPFILIGLLISFASAKKLNSLALGDELAAGLGERVMLARLTAAIGAILLCGATTAACGPIGFVGLIVPHLCRLLVGVDHRWLLPLSGLTGAALLLSADIVGRIIAKPAELQVGVVTAFIGAPFFIWIVRYQRIREL
jgi:iron complex transport system permease protein